MRDSLDEALSAAHAHASALAGLCVGAAGYFACGIPGGPEAALDALGMDAPREIVSDIEIALSGAALGEDAVVLIAGTGSVAYGGTPDGRRARAGGWGYLLSDEGSAFWIGLQAVRHALRAHDGRGPATTLTERLPAALGVPDVAALEGAVYGMTNVNTEVARLAEGVMDAAASGDAVAEAIAEEAGAGLAEAVIAVLARLGRMEAPIPVATVGGVLQNPRSPVRAALVARLVQDAPLALVIYPRLPPVGGALLRAFALANVTLTADALDRLAAQLARPEG